MNRSQRNNTAVPERARLKQRFTTIVSDLDKRTMFAIERFILAYRGDDLLHDIELNFPGASYRAFFLAFHRARNPLRWFAVEGSA
jgi:hypothetical protein